MKKVLLIGLSIVALISALFIGATAAATANQGAQVWQLDKETTVPGYQMEKNEGPGDDGQTGSVAIASGTSLMWIADEVALTDVTFSADGAWKVELATDSEWIDKNATGCKILIGEWDNTLGFVAFSSVFDVKSITWSTSVGKYIFELKGQSDDETVYTGKNLAIEITNDDAISHTIYTGEGNKASCLTSPQNDPGYPLPEIAAGILLGGGLIGLVGYVALRKKTVKVTN
jgi:hypothetical protein